MLRKLSSAASVSVCKASLVDAEISAVPPKPKDRDTNREIVRISRNRKLIPYISNR